MSKRKHPDVEAEAGTPSKRLRQISESTKEQSVQSRRKAQSPSRKASTTRDRDESPTPAAKSKSVLLTPKRDSKATAETPSKGRADQSAKRKSARRLAETQDGDDWDGEKLLAATILAQRGLEATTEDEGRALNGDEQTTPKRKAGRPKGSRNKRSPTPEGDIAPEERFFFQNRAGPSQVSDNAFSTVKLLTHDEYYEETRSLPDQHTNERAYLMKLHRRAFPQWSLELANGHNVCLYGYGSKRSLTREYAEWSCSTAKASPRVMVVNGYTPKLSVKTILSSIASMLDAEDQNTKLGGQPQEILDTLLAQLSTRAESEKVMIIINSIDSLPLRKPGVQAILARLSAHPNVFLLATADTPTFPLLWNSTLTDHFRFAFHDCTTFSSYDAELAVVDDVYDLLGRKGRRMGGKDGIKYVLKSLPPNAQNLYRILLGEILSILTEDDSGIPEGGDDEEEISRRRLGQDVAEQVGVEYRLLYKKASEEFVASSDMNFRFLLKEFHDHQMITTRRDASGTELLCVPLGKEDMQAVLEDLIIT